MWGLMCDQLAIPALGPDPYAKRPADEPVLDQYRGRSLILSNMVHTSRLRPAGSILCLRQSTMTLWWCSIDKLVRITEECKGLYGLRPIGCRIRMGRELRLNLQMLRQKACVVQDIQILFTARAHLLDRWHCGQSFLWRRVSVCSHQPRSDWHPARKALAHSPHHPAMHRATVFLKQMPQQFCFPKAPVTGFGNVNGLGTGSTKSRRQNQR